MALLTMIIAAQVDGPKPVFFTGWGEDVRYEQFLFGESNTPIEFGAEQGSHCDSSGEHRMRGPLT